MCDFDETLAKLNNLTSCSECDGVPEIVLPKDYVSVMSNFYKVLLKLVHNLILHIETFVMTTRQLRVSILVKKEERSCYLEFLTNGILRYTTRFFHKWTNSGDEKGWCCKIKTLLRSIGIYDIVCDHSTHRNILLFHGRYAC